MAWTPFCASTSSNFQKLRDEPSLGERRPVSGRLPHLHGPSGPGHQAHVLRARPSQVGQAH
eukprot:4345484-Alexandrium_andersonii.AAC.1